MSSDSMAEQDSNDIVQYSFKAGGLTTQVSSGPSVLLIKVSSC